MSKKYTCAGMNSGGRVRGYASGGVVEDATRGALSGGLAGGVAKRASEYLTHNKPLPYMKTPSQEVDEALSRQKASDDRSRRGGKD